MSTTLVTAGQVMDRVASLLNDPQKTDYTYVVQLPYLNMAIEEFSDMMAEANAPNSNLVSTHETKPPIILPVGKNVLVPEDYPGIAVSPPGTYQTYPNDLIEVQEIGERFAGDPGPFRRLPRKEFHTIYPTTNSLVFWVWELGVIRFNDDGANVPMEVELKYVFQGINYAANENSIIDFIGSRTYLSYKTAALCAQFIGENESRAQLLEDKADEALERTINIGNKGKQQIVTRHRPFRASYKMRGWV